MSAPFASELVAARKVDRLAWVSYDGGRHNVYTAVPPLWAPAKLTNFTKDDGIEITSLELSDDGTTVAFMRGVDEIENRAGWDADPSSNPDGTDRSIWAARVSTPGVAWKVASTPVRSYELAPDGSSVLYSMEGEIYRARISSVRPASGIDRGDKPFLEIWGTNTAPKWSPTGNEFAFSSSRSDHAFIGVCDVATRSVTYLSPSVDRDSNPAWSADGTHIVFMRRPGEPFGQQGAQTQNGIGIPSNMPLIQPLRAAEEVAEGNARGAGAARGRSTGSGQRDPSTGSGQSGRGGAGGAAPNGPTQPPAGQLEGLAAAAKVPGLTRATFTGGYAFALWRADVATGTARELWHPPLDERMAASLNQVRWAGDDTFVFAGLPLRPPAGANAQSAAPDEWDRYYGLTFSAPDAHSHLLTTTNGLIEDATSVAISADGKTVFYCTNATDLDRRHIWAVPVSGGDPREITTGTGSETSPAPLASGKWIATLSASWNMPQSVGIWPLDRAAASAAAPAQKIVYPASRPGFPAAAHVEPQPIVTHAADGLEIHNQLFLPKDIKPGEKRPAMVFVHGGPIRQTLLTYHYMHVISNFYAVNEWLQSLGYVVLSIDYRSGIGYGRSFQSAPNTMARGNAEYQDVVAGANYLQSRPDVDPKRVGIYGLSYGGLLTAQALARNSDIFALGVDWAGVHTYGASLDPTTVAYESSAISHIDEWKSPVLLLQADDDRNVAFEQMVGLVQLLRQRDVYYESVVFPDDVHLSEVHSHWLAFTSHMQAFLHKFFGDAVPAAAQ